MRLEKSIASSVRTTTEKRFHLAAAAIVAPIAAVLKIVPAIANVEIEEALSEDVAKCLKPISAIFYRAIERVEKSSLEKQSSNYPIWRFLPASNCKQKNTLKFLKLKSRQNQL